MHGYKRGIAPEQFGYRTRKKRSGGSAFRHYRLHITNWSATASYVEVGTLALMTELGGVDITPTAGGTPAASSEYSATYGAPRAFDGEVTTRWISARSSSATDGPQWVSYEFSDPIDIVEYGVGVYQASTAPTEWTLEASEDGVTWEVLDSRTAQSLVSNEVQRYTISK